MSRFLGRRQPVPLVIINRYPRRRADADAIALIVSGAFLLFAVAYQILEAIRP